MSDLDDRLLAAHARDDRRALVTLYTEAGISANNLDASCFYLTHAYIFALEMGHGDTDALHARLAAHGRV